MTAISLHAEAKSESILRALWNHRSGQTEDEPWTTLTETSPLVLTCFVLSAPVGGGTGSQQTILHEEQ